jgi:hypothetical protein
VETAAEVTEKGKTLVVGKGVEGLAVVLVEVAKVGVEKAEATAVVMEEMVVHMWARPRPRASRADAT